MSYEPTIVIKKADLDKYEKEIQSDWDWNPDDHRVMSYIKDVYNNYTVVAIDGIELLICKPELTSFNSLVREQLDEWGVQYGLDN